MENIWQSSKIYPTVSAQRQTHMGMFTWEYPAETHIVDNFPTDQYFIWREKLLNNPYSVRYPNGYAGKKSCAAVLWPAEDGSVLSYEYIEARKQIYCPIYAQLVRSTSAYAALKNLVKTGVNLIFSDMLMFRAKITLTAQAYQEYENNAQLSFGHSWTLAACLLGYM